MAELRQCGYINCYFNNNLEEFCTQDTITVNATGVCETLQHCDDYVCNECDMYEFCTKDKKANSE